MSAATLPNRLRWENFVEWAFYALLAWVLTGLQTSVKEMSASISTLNQQVAVSNRDQYFQAQRITTIEDRMNDCKCNVQKMRLDTIEGVLNRARLK